MPKVKPPKEIFMTCNHCKNKGKCVLRAEYVQDLVSAEDEHFSTQWEILECPVCNNLILRETRADSLTPYDELDGPMQTILYPMEKKQLENLPPLIQKEYDEALKIQHLSPNGCASVARRTLEAICAHEKATGKDLFEKINNLFKISRIPPLLGDVAHLSRKIGNLGAHLDEGGDVTETEIATMMDFIETILEYLYVLPAKVEAVKSRLNRRSDY